MAGYGPSTHWYQNLLADPAVDVLMPARPPFAARAESVTDPAVRARIIPALARSMALPGSMIGAQPNAVSDERIMELTSWVPLIALRPVGAPLVAGPDDPGGTGWIVRQAAATVGSRRPHRLAGRAARATWFGPSRAADEPDPLPREEGGEDHQHERPAQPGRTRYARPRRKRADRPTTTATSDLRTDQAGVEADQERRGGTGRRRPGADEDRRARRRARRATDAGSGR